MSCCIFLQRMSPLFQIFHNRPHSGPIPHRNLSPLPTKSDSTTVITTHRHNLIDAPAPTLSPHTIKVRRSLPENMSRKTLFAHTNNTQYTTRAFLVRFTVGATLDRTDLIDRKIVCMFRWRIASAGLLGYCETTIEHRSIGAVVTNARPARSVSLKYIKRKFNDQFSQ